MCLCTFPSSLHHFHVMLPTMMWEECLAPPKPFMVQFDCLSLPTKLLILCEMEAVHLLSTPIGWESVLKLTLQHWLCNVFAYSANMVVATINFLLLLEVGWWRYCLAKRRHEAWPELTFHTSLKKLVKLTHVFLLVVSLLQSDGEKTRA